MKITFLTTILALFFTLPGFGFTLNDLVNIQKKSNDAQNPVSENQSDTASDSASGAAVSESALAGQQGSSDVDTSWEGISGQPQSRSETRNSDSPSQSQATGGGCQKNEQGAIVC